MSSPKVGTPAWDKFQKLAAFCATKGIKIDPNNVQMNIGGAYINQGGNVLGGSTSKAGETTIGNDGGFDGGKGNDIHYENSASSASANSSNSV